MSTGKIALVLAMTAAVWGFIALWYWALFGMNEDISAAHGFTVMGLVCIASLVFVFGIDG